MKMRILLLAFLMVFQLILAGCWDYTEYEDMAQITALGFDFNKASREITVTLQYTSTTKQGQSSSTGSSPSSGPQGIVYSATAKTLLGALTKIQEVIDKQLFYGYLKVIIIGEDAAKYKMMDIIELEDRTPVIRSTAYLVVTSGTAEDTLSTFDPSLVGSTGDEIYNLVKLSNSTGTSIPVSLLDFEQKLAIGGIEATAPRVIAVSKKPKPNTKGGVQGNIRFGEEREGDLRVSGMATLKGDKFVGWLDDKESLGLRWITGKNTITYEFSEVSGEADTADMFYYRLRHSSSKIKAKMAKGKPVIDVSVQVIADLRKYYSNKGSDYLSPKELKVIEKKLSDSIRIDMEAALKKGQKELKSDIFGFGFSFFRKYPRLWQAEYEKKWQDIFPDIPVSISVDAKVTNTGTNLKKFIIK